MGWSVAKSGNTVVAGAPFYDHPGIGSAGAVWVFHQTDGRWDMQEMLLADEPEADARFGKSVAIRGDILVVGAPADGDWSTSPGAAFVFRRTGGAWQLSQELNGRGTSNRDQFGSAVAIGEGMLFVSDPRDEDGGKSGVVYVYNVVDNLFQESQILVPNGAEPYDCFGTALALGNEELLVGAPWRDSGVVYVYSRLNGAWTESNEITASDGAQAAEFGQSISTDGATLVVGAPGDGDYGEYLTGSAFVFVSDGGTWLEDSVLVPTGTTSRFRVGSSVAVSDDQIVVGSPSIDVGGTHGAGTAHVFSRIDGQWHEQLLTVPDPEVGDQFGRAVAAEGGSLVIAAPDENEIWGSDAGSVYVFETTTEVIDLDVTITNNQDLCVPGEMQEYTIVFANQSSIDVRNARVIATFPWEFEYYSHEWSCRSTGGATCRLPLWTKRLHEEVDLPAGSSLEYTAKGRVTPAWNDEETSFAAAILPPPGLADSETTNNEAIDIDPVEPHVDLVATITNGRDHLVNGQRTSYGIVVQNIGPSRAVQASVLDIPPDSLQDCSWTCHDEREPFNIHSLCGSPSSGEGAIDRQVWINPGHSVYFVLTCDVDAVAPTCTNRVEVFTDREIDTDGSNNFSEDEDPIIEIPDGLARPVSGRITP